MKLFVENLLSNAPLLPKYLLRCLGLGGIVVALLIGEALFAPPTWKPILLKEYQRQRLLVYFGKDFASATATVDQKKIARELQRQKSHQSEQALISVGSGGFWGYR